jgi:hypothetical protein
VKKKSQTRQFLNFQKLEGNSKTSSARHAKGERAAFYGAQQHFKVIPALHSYARTAR